MFADLFNRLSKAAFDFHTGNTETHLGPIPGRHVHGLTGVPLRAHEIPPGCAFLQGTATPEAIGAGLASARALAARRGGSRLLRQIAVLSALAAVSLLGYGVLWVLTLRRPIDNEGAAGMIVLGIVLVLFLAQAAYLLALNRGKRDAIAPVLEQWAKVLEGTAAIDEPGRVVTWLDRCWPWLLPPRFLCAETACVHGLRGGHPVLLVAEWKDRWVVSAHLRGGTVWDAAASAGDPHGSELAVSSPPPGTLMRLSFFIARSPPPDRVALDQAIRDLADWGYGVVVAPPGLYVYGRWHPRRLAPDCLLPVLDKALSILETRHHARSPG